MLHFLLLPLLLSAWYECPGSPARESHALCVSKRIRIIARAITFHVPSFWAAVWLYLPVPATRRPRTLLPRLQSSIRDHICCFASRLLCKPGEPELYTRPSLLHKNSFLLLELRLCFHQHHRRSKPDIECATTCESPAAPAMTSVTTTLDPTVRINSVSASTTMQASISPSYCVSRARSLINHRPLALPSMCLPTLCHSERAAGGYAVDARLLQNSF